MATKRAARTGEAWPITEDRALNLFLADPSVGDAAKRALLRITPEVAARLRLSAEQLAAAAAPALAAGRRALAEMADADERKAS